MKLFKVQLDTGATGITYIGPVGMSDYNSYSIEITAVHNGELLDMSTFSDIALQYDTSGGVSGTYRLANGNLTIENGAVIFRIPASVISEVGSVTMQLQLFTDDSRFTVLNRFMLEVKSILKGNDTEIEEEVIPVIDELFASINKKLDKVDGGTVTGFVDFVGGLHVNGVPVPVAMTVEELEILLQ